MELTTLMLWLFKRKEIIHTLKKLGHDIIHTSTTEIYWCTKTLLSCQKKNNVSLNYAISTSRRPLASPITLELSPKRSHEIHSDNANIAVSASAAVVMVHEDYATVSKNIKCSLGQECYKNGGQRYWANVNDYSIWSHF